MLRVALLSKWHVHAKDYARHATEHPSIVISKVWDDDESRGREWATELGVPFGSDLNAILTDPSIDGVVVTVPTNEHKDVLLQAARHGKHIFTEKILAFSVGDCDEIFQTAKENNVKLMVSLPRLTHGYYVYAQQAIDEGLLGNVSSVRCRLAHNGAVATDKNPNGWLDPHFFDPTTCGGGALIDLGAHPIYLTNRIAGTPVSVFGKLSGVLNLAVDDNSVVVVQYEGGALGVIEAGFSSGGNPFLLEVHGTKGSLIVNGTEIHMKTEGSTQWQVVTEQKPSPSPMDQWVLWIDGEVEPTITEADIRNLTLINEAAALSDATDKSVLIRDGFVVHN